jgi:hypothetical protein
MLPVLLHDPPAGGAALQMVEGESGRGGDLRHFSGWQGVSRSALGFHTTA